MSLDSHDARAVAILTMPADCCEHTTHEVLHPVAIQVDRIDSGAESGLNIRANDGSETRLAFRSQGQVEEASQGGRNELRGFLGILVAWNATFAPRAACCFASPRH